ncbi:MAG: hypothetical protein WAW26_09865, partial [Anaerolineae bacterium]
LILKSLHDIPHVLETIREEILTSRHHLDSRPQPGVTKPTLTAASSSKCSLVFNHRDHKERREVADLRLICRFFVFSVLFVVECVLRLELLQRSAAI